MIFNKKTKETRDENEGNTVVEQPKIDVEQVVVCEVEVENSQLEDENRGQGKHDEQQKQEEKHLIQVKEMNEIRDESKDDPLTDGIMIKVDRKDITTLEKIISKYKKENEELKKDNDQLSYHNSEIKEIIVQMGLKGKLEILEKLKCENEQKDLLNKQLENKLKENNAYQEELKINLLSGISQLFDQKPMITSINQIKNENISKNSLESEEMIGSRVLELKNKGKTNRQIASMLSLPIIEVDEILNKI
jgi:hypothetical protein